MDDSYHIVATAEVRNGRRHRGEETFIGDLLAGGESGRSRASVDWHLTSASSRRPSLKFSGRVIDPTRSSTAYFHPGPNRRRH
jgi:hypothetical protein